MSKTCGEASVRFANAQAAEAAKEACDAGQAGGGEVDEYSTVSIACSSWH